MARLELSLLGPLYVTRDGQPVTGFESNKVRALLSYLVVEADRPHRREALAGLLWPEQSERSARNNLRQALANLRHALDDHTAQPPFLLIARDTVQFNLSSDYNLDVAQFNTYLDACRTHTHHAIERCKACAQRLEQAVALYRGAFLAQFFVNDSADFEEWATLKREALHRQVTEALVDLTTYYERHGAYDQASRYAMRQLEFDPWREEAHRQLMRILYSSGQRSAALAQYESCRSVLAAELGVEPESETTALYAHVRADDKAVSLLARLRPATSPHNLPPQPTALIGREDDLRELAELLAKPACRLVTILGPGGVGKTRLALEAGTEQLPLFVDGVFFVPLAAVGSVDFLVTAIADALKLALQPQPSPKEQLLASLGTKEVLLILDNFEHLLAGAELLIELLQHTTELKLLVTSRERLDLKWEWIFDIAGLHYPISNTGADLETYSAVQMFTERAQQMQRRFVLTGDEAQAVVRICRLIEGLPLGIELAAAAVRERACGEIAAQIEINLSVLATSLRDMPARHRSLRAVFDHSWQLLSPAEQRVFRQLSVFRGGFSADAAEAVAGANEVQLAALVNKSLLRRNVQTSVAHRYDLHEVVRQYAWEELQATTEAAGTQERHLDYIVELAEQAEQQLTGPEQGRWLLQLAGEYGNIRAALQWSLGRQQVEQAAWLTAALWRFWTAGRLDEGRSWLEQVLTIELALPLPARAKVYMAGGLLAWGQGEYPQAVAFCEQSLHLYRQCDDRHGEAACLHYLGSLALHKGDYVQASALLDTSLALRQALNDHWGIALCLINKGALAGRQGDSLAAERCYEQSLLLLRPLDDKERIAVVLDNLGAVARDRSDYRRARTLYEEGLKLFRELNSTWYIPTCLNNLGGIALDEEDYARAQTLFGESLPLLQELGDKEGLATSLEGLAAVAYGQGQSLKAVALYSGADTIRSSIGSSLSPRARARSERIIAAIRGQVQAEAFLAAWERGRLMSPEQALVATIQDGNSKVR